MSDVAGVGIVMEHWATTDFLTINRKEDHLVPGCSWPEATETTDKEDLLYLS